MKPDEILKEVGKPSTYYPLLSNITGSVTTAILLSHLLKWSGSGTDAQGWIAKKTDEIVRETGLGWIEMQEAKNQLMSKSFIEEKNITDTSSSYRVNIDNLKGRLGDLAASGRQQGKFKQAITELTDDGILLSSDMLIDVARATPYAEVDNNALEGFISLYGLSKVISTLDILAVQYKEKSDPIHNPTMVLAKAFIKGVTPPDNHVSYFERLKVLKSREVPVKKEAEKDEKTKKIEEANEDNFIWKGM